MLHFRIVQVITTKMGSEHPWYAGLYTWPRIPPMIAQTGGSSVPPTLASFWSRFSGTKLSGTFCTSKQMVARKWPGPVDCNA
jgi:hypothetical protein